MLLQRREKVRRVERFEAQTRFHCRSRSWGEGGRPAPAIRTAPVHNRIMSMRRHGRVRPGTVHFPGRRYKRIEVSREGNKQLRRAGAKVPPEDEGGF